MEAIRFLVTWIQALNERRRRDERGFSAIEWLLILLAVIAIVGVVVAAVNAYMHRQTDKLDNS